MLKRFVSTGFTWLQSTVKHACVTIYNKTTWCFYNKQSKYIFKRSLKTANNFKTGTTTDNSDGIFNIIWRMVFPSHRKQPIHFTSFYTMSSCSSLSFRWFLIFNPLIFTCHFLLILALKYSKYCHWKNVLLHYAIPGILLFCKSLTNTFLNLFSK